MVKYKDLWCNKPIRSETLKQGCRLANQQALLLRNFPCTCVRATKGRAIENRKSMVEQWQQTLLRLQEKFFTINEHPHYLPAFKLPKAKLL